MSDYQNRIESLILSPEQRRQVSCILLESNEVRTAFQNDMVTTDVLRYIVSLDRRKMQEVKCIITMDGMIQANNKLLEFVFRAGNSELLKEFLMSFVRCKQTYLLRKLFNKMDSATHTLPVEMSSNQQQRTNQNNYVQQPYDDVNNSSTASQASTLSIDDQEVSATRPVGVSFSGDMAPEARLRQLEADIVFLHGSLDNFAQQVYDKRRNAQQRVF